MGRNILHHYGTGTHNCALSNADTLPDGRTGADMRARADTHRTRQARARRHMNMIADLAIVLNERACINNDILSNTRLRIDNRSGHYRYAPVKTCAR